MIGLPGVVGDGVLDSKRIVSKQYASSVRTWVESHTTIQILSFFIFTSYCKTTSRSQLASH